MLEEKWKREDQAPKIPPFTGTSQINVDLPKDATPLDLLDLFVKVSGPGFHEALLNEGFHSIFSYEKETKCFLSLFFIKIAIILYKY